jgi:hypothetical protein
MKKYFLSRNLHDPPQTITRKIQVRQLSTRAMKIFSLVTIAVAFAQSTSALPNALYKVQSDI